MEAPSGISGSAFCTVKIGVECFVKVFFGDRSERDGLSNASIRSPSDLAFARSWRKADRGLPDLRHRPERFTNLVYSRIKFSLTTTRDKDIGTFSDKSLAVARPMPLEPPVTSATFPESFVTWCSPQFRDYKFDYVSFKR